MWTGAVSFGLISIPIKLYATSSSHDLKLKQTCPEHTALINYNRICSKDKKPWSWDDIENAGRLVEISKGNYVKLSRKELDDAKPKSNKVIELAQFADLEQINPIQLETPYFALPDPKLGGQKPYSLLVEALKAEKKVGIGKVSLRDREHLAVVIPFQDLLIVRLATFPDEMREAKPVSVPISSEEIAMARQLVQTVIHSTPLNLSIYKDTYQDNLKQLVESKLTGQPTVVPEATVEARPTASLMEALKASIQKHEAQATLA